MCVRLEGLGWKAWVGGQGGCIKVEVPGGKGPLGACEFVFVSICSLSGLRNLFFHSAHHPLILYVHILNMCTCISTFIKMCS